MEYTDRQIYDMLLPKLEKNFPHLDWSERCESTSSFPDLVKMIALVYRSGYGRGEKGRSFIIGEKKIEFQSEPKWVIVDREPKIGDMVMMKDNRLNQREPDFYPIAGTIGKVYKIGAYGDCEVQWPTGTTSKHDRWWVSSNHLEVVEWK